MPSYTLYYFNYRGRAEVCRMLFTAANTQYHDKRIEPKEWDNFKSKMPCSMMPVLEIDGKTQIPQSMAIARYLAREFGFYGKNNIEMARVDYISDCVYELMDDYLRMYYDKDGKFMHDKLYDMRSKYMDIESKMGVAMRPEGQSDSQGNEILGERRMMELRWRYNDTCSRVLPFLERTLEMYNSGNQFFMGDVITMADMMFLAALENPLQENANILSRYPKLTALKNRISSHQKLSTYLKTRFLSDF